MIDEDDDADLLLVLLPRFRLPRPLARDEVLTRTVEAKLSSDSPSSLEDVELIEIVFSRGRRSSPPPPFFPPPPPLAPAAVAAEQLADFPLKVLRSVSIEV